MESKYLVPVLSFPMPSTVVILSAGRDPNLLASRNEVLRRQGHQVVVAMTSAQVVEAFFGGDFDMVLLCHTIPSDERRKIIRLVHNHAPSTPVMVVSAYEGQARDAGAIAVPNQPQDLVAAVADEARRRHPQPGTGPSAD